MNLLIRVSDIAIVNSFFNILIWAFIICLIVYIVLFVIAYFVFRKAFLAPKTFTFGKVSNRWQVYKDVLDKNFNELNEIEKEEVVLKGYKNKKIYANYIKSSVDTKKVLIYSHGWKNTGLNNYASSGMIWHREGYNVLIIDHYAHGKSEGKYIGFGSYDKENLISWINYINELFDNDCEIYLHGVSMGAHIVLSIANENIKNLKGIIADSAYLSGYELCKYLIKKQYKAFGNIISFNTTLICRIFAGYNVKKCDVRNALIGSKYPILFIHGEKDDFVLTENSIVGYNLCTSKKEIMILDDAKHTIGCMMHSEKYNEAILNFVEKN